MHQTKFYDITKSNCHAQAKKQFHSHTMIQSFGLAHAHKPPNEIWPVFVDSLGLHVCRVCYATFFVIVEIEKQPKHAQVSKSNTFR